MLIELLGITIDKNLDFTEHVMEYVSTNFRIFESGQTENYNENLNSIAI